MPIFEYQCEECGATFERILLRPQAPAQIICPKCDSARTAKLFSTFSTSAGQGVAAGQTGNVNFS